ncbi:MAG: molybdopterin-synthase adenylyltransferase MoeB [Nitrospirae bacterium]|nr:molybdopterin-synthase adenylyltransferase MoeB [Nitrospirota bacterium]
MAFTDEQIQRYSRHIILSEVGGKGQKKIRESKVFIVGAGGLGSPVALYLAAAGIGTLGIIDGDVVDLSNLQRQVIHHTADIDKPKVLSAKEKIEALNPDVEVIPHHGLLNSKNVMDLIRDYDIIIDGTDNFPAKFLINDAAVLAGKPLIHGGILRFVGQVCAIIPHKTACYRCIFNSPPPAGLVPSCQEAGVIGVLAGLIGTIQATEALKLILGIGKPLANRLMTYDAQKMEFREIKLKKNPKCPVCGDSPQIKELVDYEQTVCNLSN